MLKEIYEINEQGFVQEIQVKDFDEQGNCTEELAENIITVDPPQGLYRAKWTGTEWVEDMSQAEIDALNNQSTHEPTEEEVNAELDNAIMSATTLEELKSALVGKNKSVRVRGKAK